MSAALKTKFQAANDGPQTAPATRFIKQGPRVVPIITLRQPRKKSARWIIPYALAMVITGAAGGYGYANHLSELFKLPKLEPVAERPDPEQAPAYAETVIPPFADVVAPMPIAPALPEPLAATALAVTQKDPTSGIALPASSLQAPYPAAPYTPSTIAVIVDKIKDISAVNTTAQDDPPRISVRNTETSVTGTLLDKAQAKLDAEDGEGAVAVYDKILAQDRTNRAALDGKAQVLESAGKYKSAAAVYRRLLALNPKDETVRVSLVSALGAWGSPAAANELRRIVAARPRFAPAQAALAKALVGQDKALEALPHAWRASQIEPDNILYRLNLAIAYDRLGHSNEAVGFYREVLKSYNAATPHSAALPISPPEIRQRVNYLETLMESAGKLASPP